MAEYLNPTAGLPDPNVVRNNPFLRNMAMADREAAMAPFLGMAQEREGLDLQKARQMQQEFMSPEAQGARMSEFGAKTAKNQFDAAEARTKLELLPQEAKLKVAEIGQKIQAINSAPMRELFTQLGGMAQQLEKTPEQHRPMAYQQLLQRWKAVNPNAQIPPQFAQYTPEVLNELKQIEYGLVYTPQHQQKLGEITATGKEAFRREQEQTRRAYGVANIQATSMAAREKAAREHKPLNESQERVRLRNIVSSPDSTPEEKQIASETLRGQLVKDINATVQARQLEIIQGKTSYEQIRDQIYRENGLTPPAGGGGAAPQNQLKAAVEAAGQKFEPEKYDYRVTPDGRVQRKPKGQ